MTPKSRRMTRLLGGGSFVLLAIVTVLGLWVTPPDDVLREHVRLLYVHPQVAWVAYVAFGVTSLASLLYLMKRTRRPEWDHIAGASAEIGVVFIGLALATGSIWGRPTWGTWWEWDARMTTTLMLFLLYIGVLALRRVPAAADVRARRCAFAALLAFVDVPIVRQSVNWWRTQHPTSTLDTSPTVSGSMLWTMVLSFVAFTLVYAWLLVVRTRVVRWEARLEDGGLDAAIAARRAEAARSDTPAVTPMLEGAR